MSINTWAKTAKKPVLSTLPNSIILRFGTATVYNSAKQKCLMCVNLECLCRKCQGFSRACGREPESTECTFDKDLSNNCRGFEV